jgi:hypothetical protein
MNPIWLFPLLALGFGLAATWHFLSRGRLAGAGRTWALLSLIFGAVSVWLRWQA